ncbi:fasciclin domain-containing protein [Shinella zoogloeoides]
MKKLFVASTLALSVGAYSAYAADILDTAKANGQFKTLVAAVTAAGLVDTLKGAGPFTVFAPTDEAFEALPAGTVEDLLKSGNKDKLILTYHVVSGKVMSKDLRDDMKAATVSGAELFVDVDNGVTVNKAKVVKADLSADHGVIHVIDKVLMPPM